ncbi:hypothetical protein PENSPDRAFT_740142 [Peniophora sp. CONT]|nr:hypothetical protein PENSPDRAFT_740142 [Peniophora sp. CONT]
MDFGLDALLSGGLDPASLATLAASGGSPLDLSSILSAMSPSGDAMNFLTMMGSSGALAGTGFDPSTLLASLNSGGTGISAWTDPTAIMNMFSQNSYSVQAQPQMGWDSGSNSNSGSGSSFISNVGQDLGQDLLKDLVKSAAQYALDKLKAHGQQGQSIGAQYSPAPMQYTPAPPPTFTQYAQASTMPPNFGPDMSGLPSYTQPGHSFGQGFAQSPPPAQQSFPPSPPFHNHTSHTPQHDPMHSPNASQQSSHPSHSPSYHAQASSHHAQSPSMGNGSPPPSANSWSSHTPDIFESFWASDNSAMHPPHPHSSNDPAHQAPHPGSHTTPSAHHIPSHSHMPSHNHASAQNHSTSHGHQHNSHTSPTLHARPPAHPSSRPTKPHSHSVSVSVVHNHSQASATPNLPLPPLLPNRPSPAKPTHHAHTASSPSTSAYSTSSSASAQSPPKLPSRPSSSHKPAVHHAHTAPASSIRLEHTSAHTPHPAQTKPTLHHAHTVPAPKLHAHSRPTSMYGSHVGGSHTVHGHVRADSTPSNAHRQSYLYNASEPSRSTRPTVPEPQANGMSRGQSLYASAMADFTRSKEEGPDP